jgi:hypothetical protein
MHLNVNALQGGIFIFVHRTFSCCSFSNTPSDTASLFHRFISFVGTAPFHTSLATPSSFPFSYEKTGKESNPLVKPLTGKIKNCQLQFMG